MVLYILIFTFLDTRREDKFMPTSVRILWIFKSLRGKLYS